MGEGLTSEDLKEMPDEDSEVPHCFRTKRHDVYILEVNDCPEYSYVRIQTHPCIRLPKEKHQYLGRSTLHAQ